MSNNQTSYRQIIKATSVFGGVQVFNIIIAIVRSKLVAVLLGPAGMGINGLLISTTGLIASITNFGLGTSAVKNIAEANGTGDEKKIATIVGVFRKLVWATGLLGSIMVIVLAPWLSELTFGNRDYTIAFVLISITLLLNQIGSGRLVLLQGMRRIKLLAKAGIIGSLIGLLISVPLYYLYGIDGIVPAIIITSVFSLLVSYYFARKVRIERVEIAPKTVLLEGKAMLLMGFLISLTGLMDQLIAYITRVFISNTGGIEDVGLYSAGFAIVNTYVGMIFAAMLTDYYPRLSSVAKDNKLAAAMMNQQAEIAILILAPIILFFFVFINYIIVILYSQKFLPITEMIYWAIFGVFIKAVNWSIGIIMLAKGDSKLYFITYILASIIILSTNIAGFYFWGLKGLGIAFLASYILLTIICYCICKVKYAFAFSFDFIKVFSIQFFLVLSCFVVIQVLKQPYAFAVGAPIIILSSVYSFRELDKRLNLKSIFLTIKNRFGGRE